MKSAFLLSVLSLFLLANARADLTITQTSEGAPGMREIVIKIKGDKTRVDVGQQMAMIVDGKTGDIDTIMPDKKQVMHISGDKAKAMAEMMKQFRKSDATKPKLVPTGKKEMVSGYEAEEYKLEGGMMPATYWLSTKYPDYAGILKQLEKTKPSSWDPSKMGMPSYGELPGLPMRVVMQMQGQGDITTTITSIKTDVVGDDQFLVPKDFARVEMPNLTQPQPAPAPPAEKKP